MSIDWKKHFDKIYCIHYIKQTERLDRITTELKRIGIYDSGVFDWFYDYDSHYYNSIQQYCCYMQNYNKAFKKNRLAAFKCALTHYRLWKEICCRQYKYVFIIEDDEVFLKDLNCISKILDDCETFADIRLFDKFSCSGSSQYINNITNPQYDFTPYFRKFDTSLTLFSGGAYAISLKAAQLFSLIFEAQAMPPDEVWNIGEMNRHPDMIKCFARTNLCYQQAYPNTGNSEVDFDLAYSFVGLNKDLYVKY